MAAQTTNAAERCLDLHRADLAVTRHAHADVLLRTHALRMYALVACAAGGGHDDLVARTRVRWDLHCEQRGGEWVVAGAGLEMKCCLVELGIRLINKARPQVVQVVGGKASRGEW